MVKNTKKMYTLTEGKIMSIIAEFLNAIWRIIVAQAFQWIAQKYVIVLQLNADVCPMHRISWGLFYMKEIKTLNKVMKSFFLLWS